MTNSEIEQIAIKVLGNGGLSKFFAIYSYSINEEDVKKNKRNADNMASRFRKGKRDLSIVEMEKLLQLEIDYDKRNNLGK